MGTEDDPVRCDPEIDQDVVDQYQNHNYEFGDYQEYPIVTESDSEGGKARNVVKGESSGGRGRHGTFDMNTSEHTGNVSIAEVEYSMGDAYASLNDTGFWPDLTRCISLIHRI
jgi:hypothetical protein